MTQKISYESMIKSKRLLDFEEFEEEKKDAKD